MHPYTMLQNLFLETGAEIISECYDRDEFGSYESIYFKNGVTVRLIWDGKDGWGFFQLKEESGKWSDTSPFLTEGDLEGNPQNHSKILEFKNSAIKTFSLGSV